MAALAYPNHTKTYTTPPSTTSTTYTYTYALLPPSTPPRTPKPTVLLLHGFPSSPHDFHALTTHLTHLGHACILPDLPGYGGTSSPHDVASYTHRSIAHSITQLLDHENLDAVHVIAHDFGTAILSKLLAWFGGRVRSATFLSVPYAPPGQRFDLEAVNAMMEKKVGVRLFGYIGFLVEEGAAGVLAEKHEALSSLMYSSDQKLKLQHFNPPGALEAWLKADCRAPPSSYYSAEQFELWNKIYATQDFVGPTNWYEVLVGNLNVEEEEEGLRNGEARKEIDVPVLGVAGEGGVMSGMGEWCKGGLQVECIGGGHWVMLEKAEEVCRIVEGFLGRVDGGGA